MWKFLAPIAIAIGLVPSPGIAQQYPNGPIKIRVPYAAGGTDFQIRALLPLLAKELGDAALIVENQGGAGGQVGAMSVANAAPDGNTLLFTGGGPVLVVPMIRKLNYSLDSFTPIANVTATPLIMVARANAPYKTIQELIAYAKQNPGVINYASVGAGSSPHIVTEAFLEAAKVKMTHVPYTGTADVITSLIAGNTDVTIGVSGALLPHVLDGKMRLLASTGTSRSEFAPEVPSLRELGLDVVEITKFALFAPKGLPEPILAKLSGAVRNAVNSPEYGAMMRKMYTTVSYMGPADTKIAFTQDAKVYREVLIRSGIMDQK